MARHRLKAAPVGSWFGSWVSGASQDRRDSCTQITGRTDRNLSAAARRDKLRQTGRARVFIEPNPQRALGSLILYQADVLLLQCDRGPTRTAADGCAVGGLASPGRCRNGGLTSLPAGVFRHLRLAG